MKPIVAVLIPCYNEAVAVSKVIEDFQRALPSATIFVYDNASTDDTARIARDAGAIVREVPLRGKGNVVRQMFADIEADVYVLVDGDDTYDAAVAPILIERLLTRSLDMVNGARISDEEDAYRPGHRLGNRLLSGLVSLIFGRQLSDLLSGYRVFSRRFVKSFPALASGFEIETEFSVHALQLRMPIAELPTKYKERPEGSVSKLNTFEDGLRILRTIVVLVKEEKPLAFFTAVAVLLSAIGMVLGVPVIIEFMETGLVLRLPTAVLAASLMILAFLSLTCGMILDSVSRGRMELKRLHYLSIPVRFSTLPQGSIVATDRNSD